MELLPAIAALNCNGFARLADACFTTLFAALTIWTTPTELQLGGIHLREGLCAQAVGVVPFATLEAKQKPAFNADASTSADNAQFTVCSVARERRQILRSVRSCCCFISRRTTATCGLETAGREPETYVCASVKYTVACPKGVNLV